MKKIVLILTFIAFGVIINQSCKKEVFQENISEIQDENNIFPTKKLENPYSVINMKRAYHNLYGRSNDDIITTSHYYVRFEPKNDAELLELKKDTLLELYEYPLDYEPLEGEESFKDPRLPENQPTYQYAAVKKDYQFPNVEYKILEELFIPEQSKIKSNTQLTDKLVDEALRITNNLEKNENKNRWSRWRPAGRILVYDDVGASGNMISFLNLSNRHHIPVEKAKVRARRWFTTHVGYTNEKGYFSCNGRFRRPANYSIVWETSKFDIRNGTFGQAYYNGPKIRGNWNLTITGGKSLRFATIFRAACRYQYWNIGGLKRPNVWSKIKYSYYHRNQNNNDYSGINWGNWDFTGSLPNIRLFGKVNNSWISTNELYSTAIHETAHASHIELMNAGEIQFLQVSDFIIESWADAVEWYITKIEYNWLGNYNFDNPLAQYNYQYRFVDNKQNWTISLASSRDYSPIFIDLVDNYNQASHFGTSYPNDIISSYTMHNIEQLLKHVYGLSSLKNKLKANKPYGVTNSDIDNQLSIY